MKMFLGVQIATFGIISSLNIQHIPLMGKEEKWRNRDKEFLDVNLSAIWKFT